MCSGRACLGAAGREAALRLSLSLVACVSVRKWVESALNVLVFLFLLEIPLFLFLFAFLSNFLAISFELNELSFSKTLQVRIMVRPHRSELGNVVLSPRQAVLFAK